MADRSVRRLSQALAGCLLISSACWIAGSTVGGHPRGRSSHPDRPTMVGLRQGPTLRELQFNLCDSGIAGCYTGRSVGVAAAAIRSERPDMVTLNEVCRDDVAVLAQALSAAHRGKAVASGFEAVVERTTGRPNRCVNGQEYGVGVLASLGSAAAGYRSLGGVYPSQDPADPEERVWLCVEVPARLLACTTHTASTSTAVAFAQCRYFMDSALPMVRRQLGEVPVVLGADLNIPAASSPGPQACLPSGYRRTDDGSRQDVVVSPTVAIRSHLVVDMRGATDHPGLLVDLTLR